MTLREKIVTVVVLAPIAAGVGVLLGQATDSDGQPAAGTVASGHERQDADSAGGAADEYTLDVPKLESSR